MQGSQRCFGVILAFTEVQGGSARACQTPYFSQDGEQVLLLPFGGGGTAQPGSSAALFSSTRGTPVGMGTVAAQQNYVARPLAAECLPSNCSWWPLLWDFIPCLPVQSSKPPSGLEEGWHVSVCGMQGISCGHPTRPSLSGPSPYV